MNYIQIQITAEQRRNLIKLAQYLLSGNLKARFDITVFSLRGDGEELTCGSVGCAVGQGPYAGIPKLSSEDWRGYADRVFGVGRFQNAMCWDWMFHSHWCPIDPTPQGAGIRILFAVIHGLPKRLVTGYEYLFDAGEEAVDLYSDFPSTWAEIITAFPELQLPAE